MRVEVDRGTWVQVDDLLCASRAVRCWIAGDQLGVIPSSEWKQRRGGARVQDDAGEVIARVSYNGRVWIPDGKVEVTP